MAVDYSEVLDRPTLDYATTLNSEPEQVAAIIAWRWQQNGVRATYENVAHVLWRARGPEAPGWQTRLGAPLTLRKVLEHTYPPNPSVPDTTLRGRLAFVSGSHYVDEDTGREVLPTGCSYFWGVGQMRADPAECLRQLDAAVAAGYHYVRTFVSLGYHVSRSDPSIWRGHEVAPIDFVGADVAFVAAWPDYLPSLRRYGEALADRGLQWFVSYGDLQMWAAAGHDAMAQWSFDLGNALAASGAKVAFVDVNEAWQNWITDREPDPADLDRYIVDPFLAGYRQPVIGLRSAGPDSEETDTINAWRRPGSVSQKHGHRGHFPGDFVSAIRHARGINYGGDGPTPTERIGIESEPGGPGERPTVGQLNDPEGLALLAVSNYTDGYGYVYHSDAGVRSWYQPIDQAPGFVEVARVRSVLPADLHSAYTTLTHGGNANSPLTDADGFPDDDGSDRRVDLALADDGRFCGMVYDHTGHTRLTARVPVSGEIIVPDTLERQPFDLSPGEGLPLDYRVGRIVIGSE